MHSVPKPAICYRPATASDVGAIAEVHIASWRVAYKGILADSTLDALSIPDRTELWTKILVESSQRALVATNDNLILGFINFSPSRDQDLDSRTCSEINALYLVPEVWGQGMRSGLCERAFVQMRAEGHNLATLWAFSENSRAIAFYEKLGFHADGAKLLHQSFGKWIHRFRREV